MCRLLGIRANKPVDLEFSLANFQRLSEQNPDGWGIGWYEGNKLQVYREAIRALNSEHFQPLSRKARSHIFICHVRRGTCGGRWEENCHPFRWRNWLFVHNGSVPREPLWKHLRRCHRDAIEGETDSEVYFHWILQNIEAHEGDVVDGIRSALEIIYEANDFTGLNFLLSDGQRLYAYRDASCNLDYYSLYYLKRDPETLQQDTLRSEELGTLIRSKRLRGEKAVLICSERLTGVEKWEPIEPGYLLIVSRNLEIEMKFVRR